jgi:lipoprotein-anchoring transpeptidase ErfK/SrfK
VLSPDLTEPWLLQMRAGRPRVSISYPVVPRGSYLNPRQNAAAYARPARVSQPRSARAEPRRRTIDPRFLPRVVAYSGPARPGTVVIDTAARFLYLVEDGGKARRYGVGVGRPGFEWAGTHTITRTAEWPDWTPPPEMLERRPDLPRHMEGGPDNPLGARALYLGSTLYRIHGSNEPWTIGHAVSSGCIRMRNEDVIDLYQRVKVGTRVTVI